MTKQEKKKKKISFLHVNQTGKKNSLCRFMVYLSIYLSREKKNKLATAVDQRKYILSGGKKKVTRRSFDLRASRSSVVRSTN